MPQLLPEPPHSHGQWVISLVHEVAVTSVAVVGLLDIADAFLLPRILDFRSALVELTATQPPQVVIVTDTQGRVLPDFTLLIESEIHPIPMVLLTNAQGIATIPHLAGGAYSVRLAVENDAPSPPFTIRDGESNIIAVTVAAARPGVRLRGKPARAQPAPRADSAIWAQR